MAGRFRPYFFTVHRTTLLSVQCRFHEYQKYSRLNFLSSKTTDLATVSKVEYILDSGCISSVSAVVCKVVLKSQTQLSTDIQQQVDDGKSAAHPETTV